MANVDNIATTDATDVNTATDDTAIEHTTADTSIQNVDTSTMSDEDFSKFMDDSLSGSTFEPTDTSVVETGEESTTSDADAATEASSSETANTDVETSESDDTKSDDTGTMVFNINGQEIKVSDQEDVKRLVERGLQSAADMQKLTPLKQVGAMLENNKLMDTAKLNQLIDIANGDEKAIKALLKEKEIDPYSLVPEEGEVDYEANDHSVSQDQIALNDVLNRIEGTESFNKTANIVMQTWDEDSRNFFLGAPANLEVLNNQVADGTFDTINNEIQSRKLMGKLPAGMNDFQIYLQIGEELFNQDAPQSDATGNIDSTQSDTDPQVRLQQASDRERRKQAIAPTRSVEAAPQTQHNVDSTAQEVYSGSDEDFLKRTAHLFDNL